MYWSATDNRCCWRWWWRVHDNWMPLAGRHVMSHLLNRSTRRWSADWWQCWQRITLHGRPIRPNMMMDESRWDRCCLGGRSSSAMQKENLSDKWISYHKRHGSLCEVRKRSFSLIFHAEYTVCSESTPRSRQQDASMPARQNKKTLIIGVS